MKKRTLLFLAAALLSGCHLSSCTNTAQQTATWQAASYSFAQAVTPAHQAEAMRRSAR